MLKVHCNCRNFRGDVPCAPHKREGVHCDGCPYFEPVKERILVIKLDAVGDVLRTTCILPGLKGKYPSSRITWITRSEAAPLFDGNPYVDRVIELDQAAVVLGTDEFDIVINLDAAPLSSRLAALAKGKEKKGFGYDPRGFVYPLHPEAEEWFLMGIFDDVKKVNKKTYQSTMLWICGLVPADYSIQYVLKPEEIEFAGRFAEGHGIRPGSLVIGMNTGAGSRWEKKKWTEEGFIELIGLLKKAYPDCVILLYGGPEEVARNTRIATESKGSAIETGCNNTLREFAALLNLSSLIVTGDTMALHVAVALGKRVVALVGPTSAAELELYGRGITLTADIPCLCCYMTACNEKPDCMDRIRSETVCSSIQSLLSAPE